MEKKVTVELTERELKVLTLFIDVELRKYKWKYEVLGGVLSDTSESLLKSDFDFYSKLYCKLMFALHYNSSDKSDKNEVGD